MADIADVVVVDVVVSARAPTRRTFAVPLIAGFHTRFPELVRTYTSIESMEADGFTAEDAEHKVASALLAQDVTVPSFKVGRLSGAQTARVVTMLATARNSTVYTVKINDRTYSFTSDASATAAEIATGLVAVINADGTIPVTASVSTNNLVLTADVAGPDFFVDIADESLWASVQDTSSVRSSISTDLASILVADAGWYALLLTRNNHLDAALAAAFVQTRDRIFGTTAINFGSIVSAQDNLAANTTNLLGVLKTANYDRSFGLFSKHDGDYTAAGALGVVLPKTPGSWTLQLKSINGAQASSLTPTEQANVEANNGNHYQTIFGVDVVQQGKTAEGQFLDITVLVDWTVARVQEEAFVILTFNDKVPFTQAGASLLANAPEKVLAEGVENGGFEEGTTYVRPPNVSTLSTVDKASRYMNPIQFGGVMQGAVHKVRFEGKLSVAAPA